MQRATSRSHKDGTHHQTARMECFFFISLNSSFGTADPLLTMWLWPADTHWWQLLVTDSPLSLQSVLSKAFCFLPEPNPPFTTGFTLKRVKPRSHANLNISQHFKAAYHNATMAVITAVSEVTIYLNNVYFVNENDQTILAVRLAKMAPYLKLSGKCQPINDSLFDFCFTFQGINRQSSFFRS